MCCRKFRDFVLNYRVKENYKPSFACFNYRSDVEKAKMFLDTLPYVLVRKERTFEKICGVIEDFYEGRQSLNVFFAEEKDAELLVEKYFGLLQSKQILVLSFGSDYQRTLVLKAGLKKFDYGCQWRFFELNDIPKIGEDYGFGKMDSISLGKIAKKLLCVEQNNDWRVQEIWTEIEKQLARLNVS